MGNAFLPYSKKAASIISSRLLLSPNAALIGRRRIHLNHPLQKYDDESTVYRHTLKLQRPTTIPYQENLQNFASLIGVVDKPLRVCNSVKLGVHTSLEVREPARANRNFRVLLKFWDDMAEVSIQHLKQDDFIYVSGILGSYIILNDNGSSVRHYEVNVKEMNFVAQNIPDLACQKPKFSFEDRMRRRTNRLHLWQVFFANPSEWWDDRNSKLKPESPDFKHKDTGEALWIKTSDPPWINQQLGLLDSRLGKRSHVQYRDACSHLSPLVFDEVDSKCVLNMDHK